MALDLTDETVTVVRPTRRSATTTGPCWHCRHDNHHLCTAVGCYGCPPEHHPRKPGVSGVGDVTPVVKGGRPEGDATAHKPAHTRGGR
jgi:hypothetical protein